MQIDLKPHEHSTFIEVVKTPKWMFYLALAAWAAMSAGLVLAMGQHWVVFFFGICSMVVGIGWVTAFPEYFMRRIRD